MAAPSTSHQDADTICKLLGIEATELAQAITAGYVKKDKPGFHIVQTTQAYIRYLADQVRGKEADEIEEMARLQFAPADIALIIEDPKFSEKLKKPDCDEYKSYHRGRLFTEAEIRKAIVTQAKNGSTPAQAQMLDLMQNLSRVLDREQRKKTRPKR